MTTTEALRAELHELLAELARVPDLAPLSRVVAVRELAGRARAVLGTIGDEAVYQATRTDTNPRVAAALGITASAVAHRVLNYHRTRGMVLVPGGDRLKGLSTTARPHRR